MTDRPATHAASAGTPPKNARRRARELVVQGLYQWLLSGEDAGAIEVHVAATNPGFEKADREHFRAVLHGAIDAAADLDALIVPHLDRPAVELSPVEHAVLLLATYELSRMLEVPYRVVINEAVELTKTYGGTDGYKYVNGVLDRVAGRLRTVETGPTA